MSKKCKISVTQALKKIVQRTKITSDELYWIITHCILFTGSCITLYLHFYFLGLLGFALYFVHSIAYMAVCFTLIFNPNKICKHSICRFSFSPKLLFFKFDFWCQLCVYVFVCVSMSVYVCNLNTLKLFHNSRITRRLISSLFIHHCEAGCTSKTLENILSALRWRKNTSSGKCFCVFLRCQQHCEVRHEHDVSSYDN